MYRIIDILSDSDSREAVVVCDSGRFRITTHDLESMGLSEGDTLDEESYSLLCEAGDRLFCIKKSFEYLSYGDLSRRQLFDKLKKKFSPELSQSVCELLTERGYLDDLRLAKRYAETFYEFKNMGLARIRNELYRRGIAREDIQEALSRYEGEDQVPRVLEYAEKKYDLSGISDRKYRQKVFSGLMRAGFSCEDITDALNRYESERSWQ